MLLRWVRRPCRCCASFARAGRRHATAVSRPPRSLAPAEAAPSPLHRSLVTRCVAIRRSQVANMQDCFGRGAEWTRAAQASLRAGRPAYRRTGRAPLYAVRIARVAFRCASQRHVLPVGPYADRRRGSVLVASRPVTPPWSDRPSWCPASACAAAHL
jgi:hypothetical protein